MTPESATERTSFVYVTFISAAPDRVFKVLTSADISSRYRGHTNVSDWAAARSSASPKAGAKEKGPPTGRPLKP